MKIIAITAVSALAALVMAACTQSGNTERSAVTGGLLGAAAGAVIGNNTGSRDAGQGTAIGAATGAIAGGVAGASSDRNTDAVGYGPNGEALVYDGNARRYDDVDRRSGRTYWTNGDYRGVKHHIPLNLERASLTSTGRVPARMAWPRRSCALDSAVDGSAGRHKCCGGGLSQRACPAENQ
jgi:hypothetical protein